MKKRYEVRKCKHWSVTYQYFVVWDTLHDSPLATRLQKHNAKRICAAMNGQAPTSVGRHDKLINDRIIYLGQMLTATRVEDTKRIKDILDELTNIFNLLVALGNDH